MIKFKSKKINCLVVCSGAHYSRYYAQKTPDIIGENEHFECTFYKKLNGNFIIKGYDEFGFNLMEVPKKDIKRIYYNKLKK